MVRVMAGLATGFVNETGCYGVKLGIPIPGSPGIPIPWPGMALP